MHKQFHQGTHPGQRVSHHQKFKNYGNQKVTLNRLCKKDSFIGYFEANKRDSKKIWYGIKTLNYTKASKNVSQKLTLNIENKTISDDHIIANHFNNFFPSTAAKLLKKDSKG